MTGVVRSSSAIPLALALCCAPAFGCEYPDEGNMPLRRAVAKVKFRPDTEAWAESMRKAGVVVHYAVLLDEPKLDQGECYWPVEVRADAKLWRRFYVTPDGKMGSDPIFGTADRPRP
jgi:hypothetical protein